MQDLNDFAKWLSLIASNLINAARVVEKEACVYSSILYVKIDKRRIKDGDGRLFYEGIFFCPQLFTLPKLEHHRHL